MSYLKNRLREPSTWIGFAQVIGGAAHAYTQGGNAAAIAAIALGVASMATPDRKPAGDHIRPEAGNSRRSR